MRSKFIVALVLVGLTFTSFKPAPITAGKIEYDIEVVKSELSYLEDMMIGMATVSISFKDEAVRTDFSITMASTTVIHDGATKTGLMLMSNPIAGKKAVKLDNEMDSKETKGKYKLEYKSETKKIAGYDCKKAIATLEDGTKLNIFYTDKISPKNRSTKYTFDDLKGFPLEMEVKQDKMVIKLTASNVDTKTPASSLFNMTIPEGYELTTMEELEKMGQ